VEGRPSHAPSHNHSQHSVNVIEHVTRRNAQHREARPFQICLAQRINARLLTEFMHCSVNLNQQTRRKACEVGDIAAHRVLSSEFESCRSTAKGPPKQDLRQAHLPP
jgi:hypothetical protein